MHLKIYIFQMSRSAKVARVIPLETPDNSSSEDEDELEELQVALLTIMSTS